MKKLIDMIAEDVKDAFLACGYEEKFGMVSLSNRPDLCQYQCNGAMAAAKQYKVAPIEIAKAVAEQLAESETIAEVNAVMPGFINIKVDEEFLAAYLQEMTEEENFGFEKTKNPLTIVVDYGGPNVAKPLHIGHLRSAVIGESIKRICRFAGHNVIGDVHLGDLGLQMGLVMEGLRERAPELPYFDKSFTGEYPKEPPFTLAELEEIYPAASALSKQNEAFKERAQRTTLEFQLGEPGYVALWHHIMNVSVPDLKRNYDNLNVSFDVWKGESDVQPYIPAMVQDLIDKGLAYESQGAMVVDVQEEGDSKEIPPCIVRKSDGAALYATSDLATIVEREKLYEPDRYIYLADKRQEMHFTQVFRTARKAGIVEPEKELMFLGFGTMNGKDGKPFKTRDGGVMRLEQLIADTNEEVLKKVTENREMDEAEAKEIAKTIGLAAIKYGDLSNQATKDYIFDLDRFTSFEGNTGPYILYTMVRIKSILAKYQAECSEKKPVAINASVREYGADELALMLLTARFNDMAEHAYEEVAPHKICQYIYELADAFNSFYHNNKIIAETDEIKQGEWIALITLVLHLLEVCIDLLGFSAPDRM
ncbi:MAG: arginine--tRNA ligase [Lachnospiraceae bacterium]|nr:arginine--tRNA ligase [Lachnospiraceae bacterium]